VTVTVVFPAASVVVNVVVLPKVERFVVKDVVVVTVVSVETSRTVVVIDVDVVAVVVVV